MEQKKAYKNVLMIVTMLVFLFSWCSVVYATVDHEHMPGDWKNEEKATCKKEGLQKKYCSVCGKVCAEKIIEKLEHKFGKWVTVKGSVWNAPIVKTRICSGCFTEETKNVYAWVWVKPVVIILAILGGLIGAIVILMNQRGIQIASENIKKFCRYGIKDIKYRPKDNESGEDILGRRGSGNKNNKDDDIFNNYHQ